MKLRNLITVLALLLISLVVFTGCEGMFAPSPEITKFEPQDYSYGTTQKVNAGSSLSFIVEGEMPGGAGILEVVADDGSSEEILLEKEITSEEIAFSSLSVRFTTEGDFDVFARATTAEAASTSDSGTISVRVSSVSVTGIGVDDYVVATEGETVSLSTIVMPIDASNKSVTYTSDNTSVVSVDGSTLTAEVDGIAGIANITAETEDGGYTATAKVYVAPSNASGGTSDPYPLDVYSSDSTGQDLTIYFSADYYIIAIPKSGTLSLQYETTESAAIDYEVKTGTSWFYGSSVKSGDLRTSSSSDMLVDAGFHMVALDSDSGTENITLKIWLD